jgi:hypothetical protein
MHFTRLFIYLIRTRQRKYINVYDRVISCFQMMANLRSSICLERICHRCPEAEGKQHLNLMSCIELMEEGYDFSPSTIFA